MTNDTNDTILKIGDSVDWRGGWGHDAPKRVIVLGIDFVEAGEKYGIEVEAMAWNDVADHAVVTLDNDHWAYGDQITRVNHTKAGSAVRS